jgi:hypothetical protein
MSMPLNKIKEEHSQENSDSFQANRSIMNKDFSKTNMNISNQNNKKKKKKTKFSHFKSIRIS